MDIQLLNGDCLELMKDIPDGSIDMIAALLNLLHHHLAGRGVPLEAGLLCHCLGHILQNSIRKVGIDLLRGILYYRSLGITLGTIVGSSILFVGADRTAVITFRVFA